MSYVLSFKSIDELICREGMETQMQRLVDTRGEGESGMDGGSSINAGIYYQMQIYTTVRWIAGEKLLCSSAL